jgi:hypothetical protein
MESVLGTLSRGGRVVAAPVAVGIVTDSDNSSTWRGSLHLSAAEIAQIGGTYTFEATDGRVGRLTTSSAIVTPRGSIRVGFKGIGPWERPAE